MTLGQYEDYLGGGELPAGAGTAGEGDGSGGFSDVKGLTHVKSRVQKSRPEEKFTCPECGRDFGRGPNLKKHCKNVHERTMSKKEVLSCKVPLVECRICCLELPKDLTTVREHLQQAHQIQLESYADDYVHKGETRAAGKDGDDKGGEKESESSAAELMKLDKSGGKDEEEAIAVLSKAGGPAVNVKDCPPDADGNGAPRQWYELCVYACPVCPSRYFSPKAVRAHLRRVHGRSVPGASVQRVFDVRWRCGKCEKATLWQKNNIAGHLKRMHDQSLEEYEREMGSQ